MNINDFKMLLKKGTSHALTRYGDGEQNIFDGVNCNRKGFRYDSVLDSEFQQQLVNAYTYMAEDYYVATGEFISPCLFVNENYITFLQEYVPLFNLFKVLYVGHEQSDISALPFKVSRFFAVSNNAWKHHAYLDIEIIQELKNFATPAIVLFASGPYSNVLIHRIWQRNKKHILLNVGSVFDPFVYKINTRQYHERLKLC